MKLLYVRFVLTMFGNTPAAALCDLVRSSVLISAYNRRRLANVRVMVSRSLKGA
jgi:hypothetical protein